MESHIRGDGLFLRPWRASDTSAVDEILSSSRIDFARWLPSLPSDLLEFHRFVQGAAQSADEGSGWQYCIEVEHVVVGQCSLDVQDHDAAEIGYWIRSDRAGSGIATRAVRAVVDLAVDHGFKTLIVHCDEGNHRSAAVAKRAGFTHVATVDLNVSIEEGAVRTGREMTWVLALDE